MAGPDRPAAMNKDTRHESPHHAGKARSLLLDEFSLRTDQLS